MALRSHDVGVQVEAGGTPVAHIPNATPLPSSSTGSPGRKVVFRARISVEKDMGQQFQSVDVYYILWYWILSVDCTVEEGKIGTVFLPAQEHGQAQSQEGLQMLLKLWAPFLQPLQIM